MRLSGFFRIVWSVQLLVGVALFGVSFLIEAHILATFFGLSVAAWVLAVALELGKASAIVFHRHLTQSQAQDYPPSTRCVSWTFRAGLIALSVLCSLLFLGVQLDRPHAAELRAAALAAVESRLAEDLARLDADREARAGALHQRQADELAEARAEHQRRIQDLETRLTAEMDNVVGGVFKGPRYDELASRLVETRREREGLLADLARRHGEDGPRLAAALAEEHRAARAARIAQADDERRSVTRANFDDDERAHDPHVVAFLRMVESVLGARLGAPQFVFAFSAALSLLMELGILLAFETLTLTAGPALAAQQREEVMSEALMAELAGNAERESIRHREAMERVRKGAERFTDRARAEANVAAQGAGPESDYPRAA